jgi:hypothetical protein
MLISDSCGAWPGSLHMHYRVPTNNGSERLFLQRGLPVWADSGFQSVRYVNSTSNGNELNVLFCGKRLPVLSSLCQLSDHLWCRSMMPSCTPTPTHSGSWARCTNKTINSQCVWKLLSNCYWIAAYCYIVILVESCSRNSGNVEHKEPTMLQCNFLSRFHRVSQ